MADVERAWDLTCGQDRRAILTGLFPDLPEYNLLTLSSKSLGYMKDYNEETYNMVVSYLTGSVGTTSSTPPVQQIVPVVPKVEPAPHYMPPPKQMRVAPVSKEYVCPACGSNCGKNYDEAQEHYLNCPVAVAQRGENVVAEVAPVVQVSTAECPPTPTLFRNCPQCKGFVKKECDDGTWMWTCKKCGEWGKVPDDFIDYTGMEQKPAPVKQKRPRKTRDYTPTGSKDELMNAPTEKYAGPEKVTLEDMVTALVEIGFATEEECREAEAEDPGIISDKYKEYVGIRKRVKKAEKPRKQRIKEEESQRRVGQVVYLSDQEDIHRRRLEDKLKTAQTNIKSWKAELNAMGLGYDKRNIPLQRVKLITGISEGGPQTHKVVGEETRQYYKRQKALAKKKGEL